MAQWWRICLSMQKTRVWYLGWEDPLEKEMATHSGILAWEILWIEDPGGLESMRLQKSQTWLRDLNNNYNNSTEYMSDSLWPHGLYSQWNSPGQNTGMGSCSLLQGIFPTQESNPGLPHCRQILCQLSYQGSLKVDIGGIYLNLIKAIIKDKPTANIIIKGKSWKFFITDQEQCFLFQPSLFNLVLEVLAR